MDRKTAGKWAELFKAYADGKDIAIDFENHKNPFILSFDYIELGVYVGERGHGVYCNMTECADAYRINEPKQKQTALIKDKDDTEYVYLAWHDLEKNPNDVPQDNRKLLLKGKDGNIYTGYYYPKDEKHETDYFTIETIKYIGWIEIVKNICDKELVSRWCEFPKSEKAEQVTDNGIFNKECDESCYVHKLKTHNACIFCEALRNSPYHDVEGLSDWEILKMQEDAAKEAD